MNPPTPQPDPTRESFLHIRCERGEKGRWIRKANQVAQAKRQKDERGVLAGWVRDTLNEASADPPAKE